MQSEELAMIIVMPTMFVTMAWAFKTLVNFYQQRNLTKLHYADTGSSVCDLSEGLSCSAVNTSAFSDGM